MAQIGRISTKKLIEAIIERRPDCSKCVYSCDGETGINCSIPNPCHSCRWSVYYKVDNNFEVREGDKK